MALGRSSEGRGRISSCVTERAPWRWAVPRQSAPVSPPPMMTTSLPAAVIGTSSTARSPSWALFDQGRYSIAWWMPPSSRPGTGRSRPAVAPPASTTASNCDRSSSAVMSTPTFTLVWNSVPSACHLVEAAVEVALLHLELGDAVAQQAADAVGPLEDDHVVPGPGQLLRGGQAGGARADDGDALARLHRRRHGDDPALVPGAVDDRHLDLLDGDGVLVDAEHAGALARSGAQAAGELREVVRRVQPVDRVAPPVAVHEVVPVRDEVPERAAVVAEGDAAVHAPRGLLLQGAVGERLVHLLPVAEAHRHRAPRRRLAPVLQEPLHVTHVRPP